MGSVGVTVCGTQQQRHALGGANRGHWGGGYVPASVLPLVAGERIGVDELEQVVHQAFAVERTVAAATHFRHSGAVGLAVLDHGVGQASESGCWQGAGADGVRVPGCPGCRGVPASRSPAFRWDTQVTFLPVGRRASPPSCMHLTAFQL